MSLIADDFINLLIDEIPETSLRTVRDKLSMFLNDYDIVKKATAIQSYVSPIPEEIDKYIAYLRVEGCSLITLKTYRRVLTNFFIGVGKNYPEVTTDDIILYLATYKQKRNICDATLEAYRTAIASFFSWLVTGDYINKNPALRIKPIKYWKKVEEVLTEYQIECIRSCCSSLRDLAMIDFMLSTGCRVSEVTQLLRRDVDFTTNRMKVVGKGNKERIVYITGKCSYTLKQYLDSRTDDSKYLFATKHRYAEDRPLSKDGVEAFVKEIGKQAGIPRLHPHLFRKTMATHALRKGMQITSIQKMLGHENIETTMQYINVCQDDVEHEHKKYVC